MKKLILLALGLSLTVVSAQQQGLRIMAPAAPGGGWDQTSRSIQAVLSETKLATGVQVANVPGAAGTVGLAQFVNAKGDPNQLMTMGLVMVGGILTNKSKVTLDQVTPIARLTGEYEVLVVPAESKFQNFQDFLAAWKTDPGKTPIAGGSAGGTDHILAGLLAQANGIDVAKINYVPFAGGGEVLAALLGNQVAGGISGYGEFESQIKAGKLRAIGISSKKRVTGIGAATFIEQGTKVELANWRGIVAPPGISDAARQAHIAMITKMRNSEEWKKVLTTKNWTDVFLTGSQFEVYLALENVRVKKVLQTLGLVK